MKRLLFIGLLVAMIVTMLPLGALKQTAEAGGCKTVYVVTRGDTLAKIAARYHVTVKALVNANNIKNRNRINVGARLCIPGKDLVHPSPPPHRPPYYPPPPGPIPPGPACTITPILGFGDIWYHYSGVRAKLGCPSAAEGGFAANDQGFEHGYVIQDTDGKTIYVLYYNGSWASYPDTWKSGDPVDNAFLVPPRGYYQPQYGIGKVWREVDNTSQKLGWAKYGQRAMTATGQKFEHGMMIWTTARGRFVLYDDHHWQGFN